MALDILRCAEGQQRAGAPGAEGCPQLASREMQSYLDHMHLPTTPRPVCLLPQTEIVFQKGQFQASTVYLISVHYTKMLAGSATPLLSTPATQAYRTPE